MNSVRVVEAAASVLERFRSATGSEYVLAESGPFAILNALATHLGLTVKEDPLLLEPAIGEYNADIKRISIRPGLELGRRNFTVAHEIGHAVLHPDESSSDDDSSVDESAEMSAKDELVFRSYDARSRKELEANAFAAALLAPLDLVRSKVASDPAWSVDKLAKYFGISRSAMVSQLAATFLPGPRTPKKKRKGHSQDATLDFFQQKAVRTEAPALVLAGPGAGKTRVLVERFQWLVKEGVAPSRILALTFSNKAAGEMVERLEKSLGADASEISVSTFHSFGIEVLKKHGKSVGFPARPRLLTPADAFVLLKENLATIPLGSFEDLRRPTMHLRFLLMAVSRAKDELVDPDEYKALAESWLSAAQGTENQSEVEKAAKSLDAAIFYAAYEELIHKEGCADFGDLISLTVRLLETEGIAEEIRSQYDHILVDETQDVNYATTRMLKLIDGGRGITWAVGDPRQSIYRFRGASAVSLRDFVKDFPGARVIELQKNYRSVGDLVRFSQALQIPSREAGDDLPVPGLESGREEASDTPCLEIIGAPDEDSEILSVVARIEAFQKDYSLADIAVLTRTRAQARSISDALVAKGIPTTWAGPLESRPAFKKVMGALLLAADDVRGIVRFWAGSDEELRTLATWARENKAWSASHLLHEASEGKIGGLTPKAVARCSELRALIGFLRKVGDCSSVVERFIFDRSEEFRNTLLDDSPAAKRTRATLGDILSIISAYCSSRVGVSLTPRSFIEFVKSSLEAGELRDLGDAGENDAVTVQTMHGSKGLEWPIVFLPFVANTKMPQTRKNRDQVPIPKGLIKGEDPQDLSIEQANLFYVAITRPQDILVLSYAEKYGRNYAGISPYVTPILEAMGGRIIRTAAPQLPQTVPAHQPSIGFKFEGPIPYQALKTVDDCPKQFEYRYVLRLFDDETGYRDFHRAIKATQAWLAETKAGGGSWTEDEVKEHLRQEWSSMKPKGHWYEARYIEKAEHFLLHHAAELLNDSYVPQPQDLHLVQDGRTVVIPVDDVQRLNRGGQVLVRKFEFGNLAPSHAEKPRIVVTKVAADDNFPRSEPAVEIFYPLTGQSLQTEFGVKKLANARKKVGELILEAESGPYTPQPNLVRCRSCPWSTICPTDPQDDED